VLEENSIEAAADVTEAAVAAPPDAPRFRRALSPLAARTDTFYIGNTGNPVTQYIVFDGANSGYSPPITDVPGLIARWYRGDGYHLVFESGGIYVYRRG